MFWKHFWRTWISEVKTLFCVMMNTEGSLWIRKAGLLMFGTNLNFKYIITWKKVVKSLLWSRISNICAVKLWLPLATETSRFNGFPEEKRLCLCDLGVIEEVDLMCSCSWYDFCFRKKALLCVLCCAVCKKLKAYLTKGKPLELCLVVSLLSTCCASQ